MLPTDLSELFLALTEQELSERSKNPEPFNYFINECDWQLSLGKRLKDKFPDKKIEFEITRGSQYTRKRIDIVFDKNTFIELKYSLWADNTSHYNSCIAGTATERIRKEFQNDIEALKKLKNENSDIDGYCIFLTNHNRDIDCFEEYECKPVLWNPPNNMPKLKMMIVKI